MIKRNTNIKSALAFHIRVKHREHFGLNNFLGGVIKPVFPDNFDRAEDYFVYSTMGLNRYKVLA